MTNQSDRQQSVRDTTGTVFDYNGDWHALFDAAGIPAGSFNGRFLQWINTQLSSSYTELNGAMAAYSESQGVSNWDSLDTVVTPFTPTDLGADLLAWYDATDGNTITHSAGVVSQWNDKSTNARSVSQAGASTLRPTWNLSNAISFDGGDYLFSTSPFMYNNGGVAIYMVASAASSNAQTVISEGRSSTDTPLYVPIYTDNSPTSGSISGFIRNDANVTNFTSTNELGSSFFNSTKNIIRIVDSGADFTGYLNGTQSPTIRSYTRANPLTTDRFTIGGLLRTTFATGWTGTIYEIIIAKNDNYGLEMEGYLANKHGI